MNSKKKIREFVLLEKSTPRKKKNFDSYTGKFTIRYHLCPLNVYHYARYA